MRKLLAALVPVLCLAASPLPAADAPKPPAARELKAPRAPVANAQVRIARGEVVPAFGSAWTATELAALRPAFADLRPRARTSQE